VVLLDTIPFCVGVHCLSRYLLIDPQQEHDVKRAALDRR